MDWPAYFPELNTIEHLWDALGRRFAARLHLPENTQQLKQMLIDEWALLLQEMLHQLVLSMRRRCEGTIAQLKSHRVAASLPYQEMVNNQSVRRHLDAFTPGRIIGKLEEGRSVTSVAAEFGIAHGIVSRLWRQFKTTGTAIRGFSSGRPRLTTSADDRYIVLQARKTGGRQREKSLDTRHRRLDDRYRVLPWPEDCTVVVCLHDALYDESRFSLSSDSHRILIWRERGSRSHPSNIIEKVFSFGEASCLVVVQTFISSTQRRYGSAVPFHGRQCTMSSHSRCRTALESEDIERMDWPARSPDLNPIEHVWVFLGRRLAARTLPPVTIRELRLALQDEWAAMPQQLIDTLILNMGRRCEICLAVRGDHIPY
ncbi:transposable element Tcb1 transposase [Trichonephila clavipes]|nr:transposable element Tcb1 transposase [Trichonephila clavipes]